jgi:NitT/TauT family transport system ATP-binding protein
VASNLHKSYGDQTVLRRVGLEIPPGQFVCFLGASGCGKSTLLRLLAGLEQPDSDAGTDSGSEATAELRVAGPGTEVGGPRLGFVFQQANLLPWRTVLANIELPLRLQGVPAAQRHAAVTRALAQVGLQTRDGEKWPRMLSGGMQMRASLARALVTAPQIMLLDEPFSALDEVLRQRLGEELRQWHQQLGWTTVFVTHHVSEAVFLADRILLFRSLAQAPESDSVVADLPIQFDQPRQAELRESRSYVETVIQVTKRLREVQA